MLALSTFVFTACEKKYPLEDPNANFDILEPIPNTSDAYILEEPYVLNMGDSYFYRIEGSGEQFVLWFGVPPSENSRTPTGSDFEARGKNYFSKGTVVQDKLLEYTYDDPGTYEIVLVASSYSYSKDEYVEQITRKTVTVVDPDAQ